MGPPLGSAARLVPGRWGPVPPTPAVASGRWSRVPGLPCARSRGLGLPGRSYHFRVGEEGVAVHRQEGPRGLGCQPSRASGKLSPHPRGLYLTSVRQERWLREGPTQPEPPSLLQGESAGKTRTPMTQHPAPSWGSPARTPASVAPPGGHHWARGVARRGGVRPHT